MFVPWNINMLTSFDNRVVLLKGPDWTEHVIDKIEQSRSRNKVCNGCLPGEAPDNSYYAGFDDANGDGRPKIAYGAKGNGDPLSGGWFAWREQPEDAKSR
jgi:hypothetical protein